jgi:hypothetical protein
MGAINQLDAVKPNTYGQSDKIRWLSNLDGMIKAEIIDTHEGADKVTYKPYTMESLMTELLVGAPYDDIYVKWLEAQVDYANGEYVKYNNSISTYNAAYDAFARHYNRTHMPVQKEFTHF